MVKSATCHRRWWSVLGSVSALSLMIGMPGVASADPGSGWSASLEGGYSSWNALNLWWGIQDEAIAGKVCDPLSPSSCEQNNINPQDSLDLNGWSGVAELAWRPEGTVLDFLVRGRYDATNTENISATWDDFTSSGALQPDGGSAKYDENHIGADFEVGLDTGIGGMDIRMFGGARFARFQGKNSFSTYQYETDWASDGGASADQHAAGKITRKFTGFGPRLGFNASLPFGDSGLGADFGGSGALLFGNRKTHINYSLYELQNAQPKASSNDQVTVMNWEVSAALFFKPTANSKLSIGYRVDQYKDVMDTGLPKVENGPNKQDRTIQGPFAKFTLDF